jgi:hypothetical protein
LSSGFEESPPSLRGNEGRKRENSNKRDREREKGGGETEQYRFLISAAMVRNADSTFVEFLAEVSRKGIPRLSISAMDRIEDEKPRSRIPVSKLLGSIVIYNLLCGKVAFVANEKLVPG